MPLPRRTHLPVLLAAALLGGCATSEGVRNPSGVPVTEMRPDERGFVAGTGIEAQDIDKLFRPFSQVTRPGGRIPEGTGLGLAISRQLAIALGGDVSVESEPGRGSTFCLTLPLDAPQPKPASMSGVHMRPPRIG